MADQGRKDNGDGDFLFWGSVLIIMTIFGAWWLFDRYEPFFNGVLAFVAWVHVKPVAMAADAFPALERIPVLSELLVKPASFVSDYLDKGGWVIMPPESRSRVAEAAGRIALVLYGWVPIRMVMGDLGYRPDRIYSRRHNIRTMIAEQSIAWPMMRKFVRFDPGAMIDVTAKEISGALRKSLKSRPENVGHLARSPIARITPPSWSRAMRPEEWLVANGLAFSDRDFRRAEEEDARSIEYSFPEQWRNVTIESIQEVMDAQLRRQWRGAAALPLTLRAVFAVCALFYGKKVKDGNALILDLARLYGVSGKGGKPCMEGLIASVPDLVKRIDAAASSASGRKLERLASRHHYVESAFPTILQSSRDDRGIIASASFVWMRGEDRGIWYVLNATGSDTVPVEAAGVIAHNRAEIDVDGPLVIPHTFQAARNMLHDYLDRSPERIARIEETKVLRRSPGKQLLQIFEDVYEEFRNREEGGEEAGEGAARPSLAGRILGLIGWRR